MKSPIYVDQDNHQFYGMHPISDMTEEGVNKLVDFYAEQKVVKGMMFCTNVQRALFDSEVFERFRDLPDEAGDLVFGLRELARNHVDQFSIWCNRCRMHGLEAWLSMRMNDCHGLDEFLHGRLNVCSANWPSDYWKKNEHLRRAPYRRECSFEGAFNYSLEEVREYHLKFINELFDRYDFDGFEFDWMRWLLIFEPGGERQGLKIINDFIKKARAIADAAEKKYGHRIKFAHRIPANPSSCFNLGYDIPEWCRMKACDMIILSAFLNAGNFNYPMRLWRSIVPENVEFSLVAEPYAQAYPDAETLMGYEFSYGAAAAAWAEEADYIFLFNDCYRESDDQTILKTLMQNIATPENLTHCIRRIPITFPQAMAPGESFGSVLPLSLTNFCHTAIPRLGQFITLRFSTGFISKTNRCFLRLGFSENSSKEKLDRLNIRCNTKKVTSCNLPDFKLYQGLPYISKSPALPKAAAEIRTYLIDNEYLKTVFNAIELIPEENTSGELVWAEIIILP